MKPLVRKMQKLKRLVIPNEIGFEEGDIISFEKINENEVKLTKLIIPQTK